MLNVSSVLGTICGVVRICTNGWTVVQCGVEWLVYRFVKQREAFSGIGSIRTSSAYYTSNNTAARPGRRSNTIYSYHIGWYLTHIKLVDD